MSELVHWDANESPVPARRQTRKQVAEIEQQEIVRRARRVAAVRDAEERVQGEDHVGRTRMLLRIKGAHDGARYGMHRATELDHLAQVQSAGNPCLHARHRRYEDTAEMVSELAIQYYGTER